MGIEKVIPTTKDLGIFLRLLARSATGQSITTYSSHFKSPMPGKEMHVIIVNNKRTDLLKNSDFKNSLKCIRCAACFNTCPVYRKSGGYSYHNLIAGPIGSILAPNLNKKENADLPFASTLCGSCSNVCPVKIDLHQQLWKMRQVLAKEGHVTFSKKIAMKGMGWVLGHPAIYNTLGFMVRKVMKFLPFLAQNKLLNPWYRQRNLPNPPAMSFKQWYKTNHSA
jgi:L-lactate dehydrogenase complex protein LldF